MNSALEPSEITVGDLLILLLKERKLVVLMTLFFTLAALAYSYSIRPKYEAEVVIIPSSQEAKSGLSALAGGLGGLAGLAGISLGGGGDVEKALAVLESKVFLRKFIEDHNALPYLFPGSWDMDRKEWNPPSKSVIESVYELFGGEVLNKGGIKPPKALAGVSKLRKSITISHDKKNSIIRINLRTDDRKTTAYWANNLVVDLNERMKLFDVTEANKSIEYLKVQLQKAGLVQIQQVIYSLLESQIQKIMLASVKDDYVFSVIDPALEPLEPYNVKRKLIASLGFVLGVLVSFAVVIAKNYVGVGQRGGII